MIKKVNSAIHLIRRIDLDKYKNEYMNTVRINDLKTQIEDTVRIYEKEEHIDSTPFNIEDLVNTDTIAMMNKIQFESRKSFNKDYVVPNWSKLDPGILDNQGGGMIYLDESS
jgi:hypothetical protein